MYYNNQVVLLVVGYTCMTNGAHYCNSSHRLIRLGNKITYIM